MNKNKLQKHFKEHHNLYCLETIKYTSKKINTSFNLVKISHKVSKAGRIYVSEMKIISSNLVDLAQKTKRTAMRQDASGEPRR